MIHCQITVSSCAKLHDSRPNTQPFARAFLAYAFSCAVQTLSHLRQRVSGFPSSVVPYVKILLVFYVAKIALLFQHSTSFTAGNPAKSAPTHKRKELLCAQGRGKNGHMQISRPRVRPYFLPTCSRRLCCIFMRYPCSQSESGVAVCENALLLDELNGKSAALCQMNRQECFGGNGLLIDG